MKSNFQSPRTFVSNDLSRRAKGASRFAAGTGRALKRTLPLAAGTGFFTNYPGLRQNDSKALAIPLGRLSDDLVFAQKPPVVYQTTSFSA